jgi:hypothetical protein
MQSTLARQNNLLLNPQRGERNKNLHRNSTKNKQQIGIKKGAVILPKRRSASCYSNEGLQVAAESELEHRPSALESFKPVLGEAQRSVEVE